MEKISDFIESVINTLYLTFIYIGSLFSKQCQTALRVRKMALNMSSRVEPYLRAKYHERFSKISRIHAWMYMSNLKKNFYIIQARAYFDTQQKIEDIRLDAAIDLLSLDEASYEETLEKFGGKKEADTVKWFDQLTVEAHKKVGLYSMNEVHVLEQRLLINSFITYHHYDTFILNFLRKNHSHRYLFNVEGFLFFMSDNMLKEKIIIKD